MKDIEKNKAIELRKNGYSIGYIAKTLNISKSSASIWVRDIILTEIQAENLEKNSHTNTAIEKRRNSRLMNEQRKRDIIQKQAEIQIKNVDKDQLWLIGVMLYWAEGGKTQRSVRFSNGDPEMIRIMMRFFREICNIPESKFRGYIHIHPHLDHIKAEEYWCNITQIPRSQFFKTYRIPNRSSKNKKDSLPLGVLDVYVLDTKLFLQISGWAKGIFKIANKKGKISTL